MPASNSFLKSMGAKDGGGDHQLNHLRAAMRKHGAAFPRLSASSKALALLPILLLTFIYLFVYPKEFELQALMSSCTPAPGTMATLFSQKPDFRLLICVLTHADAYERRHLLRMVVPRLQVPGGLLLGLLLGRQVS